VNPLPFLVGGLVTGAIYGLAGMGLVFTYQVSRVINFAYGANAMFCAFCYWQFRVSWHMSPLIAVPLAVLVIPTVLALVIERIVYRRLADASMFAKTAASMGLLLAFYGMSLYLWNGPIVLNNLTPPSIFPTALVRLPGVTVNGQQIGIVLCVAVIVIALILYLRLTTSGVTLRAVVVNRNLAEMRRINSVRVTRQAWVVSYILSGLAGLLLASFTNGDPSTLTLIVIDSLAAAALGGMVSLGWALGGGLLLGLGAALMVGYLPSTAVWSQAQLSLPFLVLLVALVLRARSLQATDHAESRTALLSDLAGAATARRPQVGLMLSRVVLVVIAVVCLQLVHDAYGLVLVSTGVAYGVIFLSYRVLTATTGLVSLAQVAFAGIGAFTAAQIVTSAGWPWYLGVLGGGAVAGASGAVVALPTVRLRGLFLTVATLAFAELVISVVFSFDSFTGGVNGIALRRPQGFETPFAYTLLLIGIFVVAGYLCELFQYSVVGQELRADLGSPAAARSIGIRSETGRLISFVIAAALAGIGGALLAGQVQRASSNSWDVISGFLWLTLVASGGVGSTGLMIQMGVLTTVLPAVVQAYVPSLEPGYVAIFGVLGLVLLRIPGGAAGAELRMAMRIKNMRERSRPSASGSGGRRAAASGTGADVPKATTTPSTTS
jgi:branched-subunit amino acid ABC-type transport system permease component